MAQRNFLDAAVCNTMETTAVVTVGEYPSKDRISGSLSPRMHHLDLIVGGSPGSSAGFLEGSILPLVPASLSWRSISSDSSGYRVFTAPDAPTFAHSSPSATFQGGHSSGLISLSFTSSLPLFAAKISLALCIDTLGFSLNSVKPT